VKPVKLEVLTGPQGGGKSRYMREQAISTPGRYLFALPTLELIDEQVDAFRASAPHIPVVKIHSGLKRGTTVEALSDALREHENAQHAVIVTTHETLMAHSLEGFDGWHGRIDEAPNSVQAGNIQISATSRAWLDHTFALEPFADGVWSYLTLTDAKPNWKVVASDPGTKPFAEIIKIAGSGGHVFVRASDWESVKKFDWFSIWTPLNLEHFASVTVAGTSYTDSVGFKAARSFFHSRFEISIQEIGEARTGQPHIKISYFTRGHEGTTTLWAKSEGRLMIKNVCDHLAEHLPDSSYWSANDVVQELMEHRLKGQLIRPLVAGLNKYRQSVACAFIYSAKLMPSDRPLLDVFDLTEEDIRRAREEDAIAQFVMRGAIRDPDYGGEYDIYLYSETQAKRLQNHLATIGFMDVEIIARPEAGIMDVDFAKRPRDADEAEEDFDKKIAARREKERKRSADRRAHKAQNEGRIPGKRGRPKGQID
jgi:hypothetical protein